MYAAGKTFAQLAHAIQDRVGNVIEQAEFRLKYLDGTDVPVTRNIAANAAGSAWGANPSISDIDGYPGAFYRHGDYIAQWTAFGDTTTRVIRIPPVFEDFAMVDVTKFDNVDPTGVLDSTAGIQAAIDQCAGKFRLFFPPGDYRTSYRLTLLDNTYLMGASPHLSRIFADGSMTGAMFFHDGPIENVIVENLCIDGDGIGRDAVNPNFKVGPDAKRVHLRNCWVIRAPVIPTRGGMAVMMSGYESSVTGCIIGDGGIDGLWLAEADRSIIANNFIYDCGDDGISMWGATRCTVVGNVLANVNAIPGGRINGRGIVLGQADRCVVNGNYVEGWERACIGIDQAGPSVFNQITGNVCALAGQISDSSTLGSGLLIRAFDGESGAHNNFVGNLVMDPREHGFRIEVGQDLAYVEDINIESNYFVDTGTNTNSSGLGAGISVVIDPLVTSKVQRINISNNYIKGFDKEGIRVTGISSNRIKDVTIDNNRIYNSGDFVGGDANAIKLNYLENFTLRNNKGADVDPITDTQLGLWIDNPSGSAIITGNDFLSSKTYNMAVSNMHALAYFTFANNLGIVPFSGRYPVASGAWTPFGSLFKKTITIPYGNNFSINAAALLPRITATLSVTGWVASVTAITNNNFTIEVLSLVGDPGPTATGTIHWDVKF